MSGGVQKSLYIALLTHVHGFADVLICESLLVVTRSDCRKSDALEKQNAMSAEERKEAAKRMLV